MSVLILGTLLPATSLEQDSLPEVISASAPLYPPDARKAHIDGVILLRVKTDGSRASSIEVISGQPMLARIATENIRTWEFEKHVPTTFETTFRYRILPSTCDDKCVCKPSEEPAVVLRLPREVDISGAQAWICEFIQHTTP